jgi:hypothetical protein
MYANIRGFNLLNYNTNLSFVNPPEDKFFSFIVLIKKLRRRRYITKQSI